MQALLMLVLAAQLDKPPEFSSGPGFQKSQVDAAIDSAAHTSGQRTVTAKSMVRSLAQWRQAISPAESQAWEEASAELQRGALAAAAGAFRARSRQFPASVRLMVGHATALYAQGDYAGAADVLVSAARRFPRELRLIPYLSDVGDVRPGVPQQLRTWADAYPGHAEAQYAYGLAIAPTAPAQAEKRLLQAAQLAPSDPRPRLALAKVASNPLPHLEAAVQLDPQNAQAHYQLAQAYQSAGNAAKAAEHLERYKALKR